MILKARSIVPVLAAFSLVLALAVCACLPQDALAKGSPWGAGTTYNAKTQTLTVKSGKHTLKSLDKKVKTKRYYIDKLIIKGGITTLKTESGMLGKLTISKGKLVSQGGLSVYGKMKVTGGTAVFKSSQHYRYALRVSDDLVVIGGKITVQTTKESSYGINVSGDMLVKKGSISITTKGKNSAGLQVYGYLKNTGGKIAVTTKGKSAKGIDVSGDILMSGGSITANVSRSGVAIDCWDLLKVTGGKISAQSASGEAIKSGEKAVLKSRNLGTIKGQLPVGAQFTKGGVTYEVTEKYSASVSIVKGQTSAASVSFGGVSYSIA